MTIDPKIRTKALDTVRERRSNAQTEQARRTTEVYKRIPRIRQLDSEMRRDAAQAASQALRGGQDSAAALARIRDDHLEKRAERAELLMANGLPMDYLDIKYTCRRCNDTGYIGAEPCSCFKDLVRRYQVEDLCSMLDIRGKSFDTFDFSLYSSEIDPQHGVSPRENAESVFDFCADYARNFAVAQDSLFLNGDTGLGKTFISACIAREVANSGFSVVYDTAVNIINWFEREHFSRDDSDAEKAVSRILNCDLLIVDDLGTELTTAFTQSALYTLINSRLISGRKSIISSNLTMLELRRRYTPQIVSRIDGEYKPLFFFGRDLRIVKREREA